MRRHLQITQLPETHPGRGQGLGRDHPSWILKILGDQLVAVLQSTLGTVCRFPTMLR